ncbi:MAG: hypothetical protein P8L85_14865 [Rubripirellula sp.]|nr:hypothetical protein [Planctomycetaceae bacterium]MDG2222658.1 hypothetical protein [Rubripirellula sp.]
MLADRWGDWQGFGSLRGWQPRDQDPVMQGSRDCIAPARVSNEPLRDQPNNPWIDETNRFSECTCTWFESGIVIVDELLLLSAG